MPVLLKSISRFGTSGDAIARPNEAVQILCCVAGFFARTAVARRNEVRLAIEVDA